jgi:hypothetical protein
MILITLYEVDITLVVTRTEMLEHIMYRGLIMVIAFSHILSYPIISIISLGIHRVFWFSHSYLSAKLILLLTPMKEEIAIQQDEKDEDLINKRQFLLEIIEHMERNLGNMHLVSSDPQ